MLSLIQQQILETKCPNCERDSEYLDTIESLENNEDYVYCTACNAMIDDCGGIIKN